MRLSALCAVLVITSCLPKTARTSLLDDLAAVPTVTDGPVSMIDQSDAQQPSVINGTNPIFVAAGYQNRHAISTNGTTWTHDDFLPPVGAVGIFSAAVIGNGIILLAGDPGVYRSTDGITYTQPTIPASVSHEGCGIFAQNKFVFVSNGNSLVTTDGINWDYKTGGDNIGHCHGIAYGNGYFVVYGDAGAHKRSTDGLIWTDFAATGENWTTIDFVNGSFVAVNNVTMAVADMAVGYGHTAISSDGLTFTDDAYFPARYGSNAGGVAYGNGVYSTSDQEWAWWSTDAKNWQHTGNGYGGGHVVFLDGQFVGVGGTTVLQSSDGKSYSTVLYDTADGGAKAYLTALGAGYFELARSTTFYVAVAAIASA